MGNLSYNKGEWSEFYVFLRSLDKAKIYAADSNLQRLEEVTYAIKKIIREEGDGTYHYEIIGDSVRICKGSDVIGEFRRTKLADDADIILNKGLLAESSHGTIYIGESQRMMVDYHIDKISASSTSKEDITLVIRDNMTGKEREYPFSIKSFAGHEPTLINPSGSTNFIYHITGKRLSDEDVESINNMFDSRGHAKVKDRLKALKKLGCSLEYCGMENGTYEGNLRLVDYCLPKLIAEMLRAFYEGDVSSVKSITEQISREDPLGMHGEQPFYSFKVKKFLIESFTGMVASKPWNGYEKTHGGYLVVKEDGEILCLHLNNRNEFEDYLYKSTKFDSPSVHRYKYATIYRGENGEPFIKLNLQIRFAKMNAGASQ